MKKKLLVAALALGMSQYAVAEDTSSSIRGKILDPQGNAAANTTIIIVHEPSGTRKTVTTNESGTFNATGLRVGGPYRVTVDSDVHADQEYDGIYLTLGNVERLDAQLESADTNTVVITGARLPSTLSSGSGSVFGEQAIRTQSGVTRDIKDVVRANPLVTILPGSDAPISIGGLNPRFNSFTVDGISQNDDFGLNSGGYPTQRSPLPIDSLDQVTVDVAPFDAKVSGFSGGLVNAVFKSGTNDFEGSVFWEKLDSKNAGEARDVDEFGQVVVPVEFEEETYGFNFSGPIMKDKLFFMVSYEFFDSPQTLEWGAAGSGAANETEATLAEVSEVQRIAQEVYGLSAAQVGEATGSPVEEDEKYVLKFDWNINDFHRASFAYQFNEGNRTRNLTSSAGELRLSSHWYNVTEELNNFSTKLYSDWNENFSTEISLTKKDVANRQVSFGDFADVTIDNLPSGGRIAFGSDQFRHANILDTGTTVAKFDAEYLMGDHQIQFGFEYQEISIQNLFVPSSKGVIEFDGLDNFENRIADNYTYSNGTGNDPFAVGADFDRETLALYVQDSWDITADLNVNFGLRYERLSSSDRPPFNANSLARTGLDNSENLDGIDIILPRVSFEYLWTDDVTLRGGVGRFGGGQPNVWISNAYSENGVNNGFYDEDDVTIGADSILNIYQPAFDAIQNASSDGNVSFTDPNFELPSDWRYQIATDVMFDIEGFVDSAKWTTEFMHIDKQDSVFWVDASLQDATVTTAADGRRLIYTDNDRRYDLMLTNTDVDGRSNIFLTSLDMNWDNGWSVNASYTNQDITEVNPGTSSTARSNYRFSDGINRNVPRDQLGVAAFEIEHRFVLNVGYNTELFDGYETNINLFAERRSGVPVTHTTNFDRSVLTSDVNGEVIGLSPEFTSGDYTSYIPTVGDPNVVYTDPALEGQLQAAISERGLSAYAGGYAPIGSDRTPYITNIDLSINQEIPGLFDDQKGVITLIIDNFLNFIDHSKGQVYDNRFNTLRLYDVDSIDDQGRYVIDRVRDDGNRFNAEQSAWRLKLGVKYTF
ncbi:hypothetical protein FLL45_01875 [Aliikangiella marina]|uniref:TonB-dependent receptor n=1 Tax=Aliikangiella marina TaxID=1712262 RepID=A0A545THM3_9GAMM|nr:TonB-dependent receptor [Aliikangiella marina]TQV76729.1 hypothetical protein FLL45_01875 [Aliikangiella marina]